MNDSSLNISELINAWLDGSISPEQADLFSDLLEKDTETGLLFRDNVIVDFILNERYGTLKKVKDIIETKDSTNHFSSSETSCIFLMSKLDSGLLEELIRQERDAKPIHEVVISCNHQDPGRFYKFLRYWFVPRSPRINHGNTRNNGSLKLIFSQWSDCFFYCFRLFLLIGFIGTLFWFSYETWRTPERSSDTFRPLARIAELVNAEWEPGGEPFKRGQTTGPNELFLQNGLVRLDFHKGAKVVLEGPARLIINSQSNIFCRFGKVHAHIPAGAAGFRVVTPFADFVDRGTDFSVLVKKDEARLDVIKGRVDMADSKDNLLENLVGGTAFRIDSLRKTNYVPVDEKGYISEEKFMNILLEDVRKNRKIISERDLKINRDSRLLIRFDLDGENGQRAPNVSQNGLNRIPYAELIQCSASEGPLYGTKSVRLDGTASRIVFDIPGKYKNMTMMALVRIDRLNHSANILVHSEDFLQKEGSVLWQITQKGIMQVFIDERPQSDKKVSLSEHRRTVFQTPQIVSQNFYGVWIKMAVVFDSDAKEIRQYVDGRLVSKHQWPNPVLLVPRRISLGSETREKQGNTPTFLEGAWREFRLYDQVLDGETITR